LQGTWEGQLDSKWRDPTSNLIIPPIHVFLVIRQTFTTISCAQFTAESESFSSLGQFTIDEENEALYLRYNYTNRPKSTIRDRSTIHDGAALLRVISEPAQRLNGEYWTSRCTAGEMSLRLVSRELRESYPAPKKA
jgi:hypothetical protein